MCKRYGCAKIPVQRKQYFSEKRHKEELIQGLLNIFHNDIDIAIIMKNEMNEDAKEKFISWSADKMKKWGNIYA